MGYCTVAQVRTIIGIPSGSDSPISDSDISTHITFAEQYVNEYTGTVYWSIEDSGTATAGGSTTLTDSGKSWTTNAYAGYTVWVYGGTGSGQYRVISSNTSTQLTVSVAWTTNPDATSTYRIVPPSNPAVRLGLTTNYVLLDGTGTNTQFLDYYPIQHIRSLTIAGTAVDIADLAIYAQTGQVTLKSTADVSVFSILDYQQVQIDYFYGVYPIPTIITHFTAICAGISALAQQQGGTYKDFNSITLPELSGSKGDIDRKIRGTIDSLLEQKTMYEGMVRKKPLLYQG